MADTPSKPIIEWRKLLKSLTLGGAAPTSTRPAKAKRAKNAAKVAAEPAAVLVEGPLEMPIFGVDEIRMARKGRSARFVAH